MSFGWGRIQWQRHEPGTWLPRDHNEFHNCPLYKAVYEDMVVSAHRTKDAKRWTAHAYTRSRGVPHGRAFNTRLAAFWDAVERFKQSKA